MPRSTKAQRALRHDLRIAIAGGFTRCMDSTTPVPTSPLSSGTLTGRVADAFGEVLERCSAIDLLATHRYLELFLNTGKMRSEMIPPLSGRDSARHLESAREAIVLAMPADAPGRTSAETAVMVFRMEVRLRPLLLLLTGLLRIASGKVSSDGSARKRATDLADTTFFEVVKRKGKVIGWEGRMFGPAVQGFRQELRNAAKAKVLTQTSHAALRAFGVSVGAGGNEDGKSRRVSLYRLRNAVSHGDVAIADDATAVLKVNAAWRTWARSGKPRRMNLMPPGLRDANLDALEGLLCLAEGMEAGAIRLLRVSGALPS